MKNWGFSSKHHSLDNWPKKENGEPVAPAFLEHVPAGQLSAEVDINLLEAYGIPVIPQYPNNGTLGKVVLGMPGCGIELYVPETLLEDAQNILSGDIIEENGEADE